jgi:hypothetical protein
VTAAASEAVQAQKEAAERSATAEKALPEVRARADALALDLAAAERKIEALTAAASETARAKEAAERSAAAAKTLPAVRARGDALARDLEAAQRKIEALTAAAGTASADAARAKEAAERSATAAKALPEVRARADALARDLEAAQRKIETLTAAVSTATGDTARVREEATRLQEQLQRSGQQERDRTNALERDLAALRRELEATVNASVKSAAEATRREQVTDRTATALGAELQEERAKVEKLDRELGAARNRDKTAQNERVTEQPRSQQPGSTAPASTALPAQGDATTASLSQADKAPMPAGNKTAAMAPPPASGDGPANPETTRLMARANLLLSQGNVSPARVALERAAETGSASALFALAQTYDPHVLAAWGTLGTQGDVAKARELYAKALAGGVHEAQDRLNALTP